MTYQKTSNEDTQTKKLYGRHGIIIASSEAVNNDYYYCRIEDSKRTIFEYTDNRIIECDMDIKPFINKPKKIEEVKKMENTKIELTGLDAIKEDIKELRSGLEVSIFGQRQVLESEVDEVTVDILDIIEKLESFEVKTSELLKDCEHCKGEGLVQSYDEEGNELENEFEDCEECDGEGYITEEVESSEWLDTMYEQGYLEELKHDNSYNWSSLVSNHFDFKTYKNTNNDNIYVEFKVHRYGDVRSNYTDVAILECSYDTEFLEAILECDKTIEVDGYDCTVSSLHEGIEVYKVDGEYITTVYPCDMKELKKEISELNN